MRKRGLFIVAVLSLLGAPGVAGVAAANVSHRGWPKIDGMLLMNKLDHSRPLDARPGHDPFGGEDGDYKCDGVHFTGSCQSRLVRGQDGGRVVGDRFGHNELLGAHGDDVIHAGPFGDVLWGDYKPTGNTTHQHDRLYGGRGDDFIYTSHGRNHVRAGRGVDIIHAYWGRGSINCGRGRDIVYTRWNKPHAYRIRGCERRSVNPTQSAPRWALKALRRHRRHEP